jgi:hypothetical protein
VDALVDVADVSDTVVIAVLVAVEFADVTEVENEVRVDVCV